MINKKLAIITGGSSGIGYATAERFISAGYLAVITGRNEDKLEAARKLLGDNCVALHYDMKNLKQAVSFTSEIVERFGRIDVLVNNAGINQKKAFIDVSDEDYENIITVNQTALFALSREVVKQMLKQDAKGTIVHISSMTAHFGLPKVISYSASKTAIEGMTRAMAVELSPLGIRVNSVAPGFIKTNMTDKALNEDLERKSKVLARTPMDRLGNPAEVAEAVYFLSSDAASFITGEVLKVDGGNSIGF